MEEESNVALVVNLPEEAASSDQTTMLTPTELHRGIVLPCLAQQVKERTPECKHER